MRHKHRSSSALGLVALVRVERAHPWTWALDGGLVLAVLMWFALRATPVPHPEMMALYSAMLIGTIVHRIFSLMDDSGASRR